MWYFHLPLTRLRSIFIIYATAINLTAFLLYFRSRHAELVSTKRHSSVRLGHLSGVPRYCTVRTGLHAQQESMERTTLVYRILQYGMCLYVNVHDS